MGLKFNPLTAQFDLTGSGGGGASYIDGEVATYNDLPLSSTTAPLDSAWLVRSSSGVWPFTKPGGVYVRTATGGSSRDADYTYAGVFPDVFSDANFTIYDDADTSKNLKFQLSGISAGTTRTLTAPNASGRIQVEGQPIGNTTPSTGAFTTLSASGAITAAAGTAGTPTTPATALGVQWSGLGGSDIAAVYGTYAGAGKVGIGVGTSGILTEVASFALGGIALNRSVVANNGTLTASAPVLDLSQTWNNAAVTFTGLRFNVTNTASAATSPLIDLQVGGVSRMRMTRGGVLHVSEHSLSGIYSPAPVWTGSSGGLVAATNLAVGANLDTILERDAADTLAQRRSTNAQTFRLYNTFTDASNYERGFMRWNASVLEIGTEALGTGSSRDVAFFRGGARQLTLLGNGAVRLESTGQLAWSSRGAIFMSADGVMWLSNNAGTDFGRLAFGGTTSSFPALKRSSTTLQVRLADDSAFAPLEASGLTLTNTNTFTVTANATSTLVGGAAVIRLDGVRLAFATGGTDRLVFSGGGDATFASASLVQWLQRIRLSSPADGQFLVANNAGTDFDRVQLGGTTSSFPAIKRSSAILQARLADDSGYTVLDAQLRAQGTAPATSGATGTAGDIRYDADYIYVCTATNTWKRAAIATW